jgi:ADP-heptose:LPS heptosyltransferase
MPNGLAFAPSIVTMLPTMQRRILVIRLGALGDLFLARDVFHAVRLHHAADHITLLTRPAFAPIFRQTPWFDEVWPDSGPKFWQVVQWLELRRTLRAGNFSRVYDLQGTKRSRAYFRLFGSPPPEWVGNVPGCSHPRPALARVPQTADKIWFETVGAAGVQRAGPADMAWLGGSLEHLQLPDRFVVLVPGCAPHRPYKRWPAENFAELARGLAAQGVGAVVVGTRQDHEVIQAILRLAPTVVDVSGRTDFGQLAELGRRAMVVIGNDTGPVHVIAAVGAPTLVLLSESSHPFVKLPEAKNVQRIQVKQLSELSVETVRGALQSLVPDECRP